MGRGEGSIWGEYEIKRGGGEQLVPPENEMHPPPQSNKGRKEVGQGRGRGGG